MAKGFGIAALVLAVLSMFSPYGVNFAAIWLGMIFAIVAALNGDRGLSIAAVVIAWAGLAIFSPITLAAIVTSANRGNYAGIIFGFVPMTLAIIALIVDSIRRRGTKPASGSGNSPSA